VQLNGVASTVQVGKGLQAATRQHAALSRLVVPVGQAVAAMLGHIRHSIEPNDARILDKASTALGELRQRRRDNAQELRRSIEEWSRRLHAQGTSERAQVLAVGEHVHTSYPRICCAALTLFRVKKEVFTWACPVGKRSWGHAGFAGGHQARQAVRARQGRPSGRATTGQRDFGIVVNEGDNNPHPVETATSATCSSLQ